MWHEFQIDSLIRNANTKENPKIKQTNKQTNQTPPPKKPTHPKKSNYYVYTAM